MSKLLLLSTITVLFACTALPQSVVESEASAAIDDQQLVVRLAIESTRAQRDVPALIELIDPQDLVRKSERKAVQLTNGKAIHEFRFLLGEVTKVVSDELPWLRVRYTVGRAAGIISLSQMIPEYFELQVTARENVFPGTTHTARVRAVNPFTALPQKGVELDASLQVDRKDDNEGWLKYKSTATTDVDGYAFVSFTVPPDASLFESGEIQITGRHAGLVRYVEQDVTTEANDPQIITMTDKPLYQPGQMLFVRGIVLKGTDTYRPLGGRSVEIRIVDEEDTVLYKENVVTSAFGVASLAWRIPTNAKLGTYTIEVHDDHFSRIGSHTVKISRYDLPNFVVTAKATKPYYLASDKQAEVEVNADYLFGKPVSSGKVRIVQEKKRTWNRKTQKYDIDEGEVQEGETDKYGKFRAKFDLSEWQKDLDDGNSRTKYRDVNLTAYFTDSTTNKTEQRRLDIRLTTHPIHVYLATESGERNPRLPVVGYVSTFTPDGKPVACNVEIKASEEYENKYKTVARIKTNSLGVGKFEISRPNIGDLDDDIEFRFIAKDTSGGQGILNDDISFDDDDDQLRVGTDRAIYKPGDPINVKLLSTIEFGTAYVDVAMGSSVILSRSVDLKNGRAELQIPFDSQFRGELTVSAFVEDPDDEDEFIVGARGVVYPSKQAISVDARFDKAVYKPNEEGKISLGVFDTVNNPVESSLGVVMLDKAVEERSRTDAAFGGVSISFGRYFRSSAGFANYGVSNLTEIDITKPITAEMQLVGEAVLRKENFEMDIVRTERQEADASSVFAKAIEKRFKNFGLALTEAYEKRNHLHPVNEDSLRDIVSTFGIDIAHLRDPWGSQFRYEFSVQGPRDLLSVRSNGPDKLPATDDDFTAFSKGFEYFAAMGKAIDATLHNYNARTGEVIRGEKVLLSELGVPSLLDRWGRTYRLETEAEGRIVKVKVMSSGKNGIAEKSNGYLSFGDDFAVWTSSVDIFAAAERRIVLAQNNPLKELPRDEESFKKFIAAAGVNLGKIRDGNNASPYIVKNARSRDWQKLERKRNESKGNGERKEEYSVKGSYQEIVEFTVRGAGRDGKPRTYDDINFAQFVFVLAEKQPRESFQAASATTQSTQRGICSISGLVTDEKSALVAGASVYLLTSLEQTLSITTTTEDGKFSLGGFPCGTYRIRIVREGFVTVEIHDLVMNEANVAMLNVVLNVRGSNDEVRVEVDPVLVQTETSIGTVISRDFLENMPLNGRSFSSLVLLTPGVTTNMTSRQFSVNGQRANLNNFVIDGVGANTGKQTSTPRLREYFPETLLWQPEVITGTDGRAEVKFRMADSITTWKMYTIASTKDGKIGFAEKETTAFQSFFVDLDPPKFLTVGDEIHLPSQVRNYTEKKQNVGMTMAIADWFTPLTGDKQQIAVESGKSSNAVFGFRVLRTVNEGKQRVTAIGESDSDAIERPVTVRPNGREMIQTESRYLSGSGTFNVNLPANAIPHSHSARVKIYPNTMAHVTESVEGLLKRPYGCGEQTISSTYPNLMILKFAKASAGQPRRIAQGTEDNAMRFLQDGYERLIGYQVASGGFSYWGGTDSPDLALTAYALRFLSEAQGFISVDESAVKRAADWLIGQQLTDGSWKKSGYGTFIDESRTLATTSYVVRTLAMLKAAERKRSDRHMFSPAFENAMEYLLGRTAKIDDAYAIALLGLAARDAGDEPLAKRLTDEVARVVTNSDSSTASWELRSSTVFNGWGNAGNIETTALATQLLLRSDQKDHQSLAAKGMHFLLKGKDRYGVWYSTQTTINVLDTLLLGTQASSNADARQLEVIVNGQVAKTISIGGDDVAQLDIDISANLANGLNNVEIRTPNGSSIMAQLVASHYVDWTDAAAMERMSENMQLDYRCDKTDAAIMAEVTCSVDVGRRGDRRDGMLLVEIGTPPGADVSRESLEAAKKANFYISRYDILPDRIVFYLWSQSAGTKFDLKFRPRYGINAQTPESVAYDYYNPEARASVAPLRFAVR